MNTYLILYKIVGTLGCLTITINSDNFSNAEDSFKNIFQNKKDLIIIMQITKIR